MDAGLVSALAADRTAQLAALEVDEMHVPHVADAVSPAVVVLLNLSRDQLDRVGEINAVGVPCGAAWPGIPRPWWSPTATTC